MTTYSHQTAPTQFVDAGGVRFAYRRFGKPGGVPVVLNLHFIGTMDHWDPLVTDGLAATREVILLNNADISFCPSKLFRAFRLSRSTSRRSGLLLE